MFTFASVKLYCSLLLYSYISIKWNDILPVLEAVNARNMYSFKGIEPVHMDHNMVIFVLDRVIWPFQVHHLNKSLSKLSEIKHSDVGNLTIFPEVHYCLDTLQKMGYVLAAVCNCKVPNIAEYLLDTFDISRYFAYQVCSEKDKLSPVQTLHEQSGVDFEDMLYFDYDLTENLPLFDFNITFCPVDDSGISREVIEKSLAIFSVRTTLIPPMTTTVKQKKAKKSDESSDYSVKIDYNELDFKRPSTHEILRESSSSSSSAEENEDYKI